MKINFFRGRYTFFHKWTLDLLLLTEVGRMADVERSHCALNICSDPYQWTSVHFKHYWVWHLSMDLEPVVNVSSIDLDDRQHLRETLDAFELMRPMIWEVHLTSEHHCRHWCDVVWKTILVPGILYSSVLSLKVEKSYFNRSDCTVKNHDENCKLRIPRCKQH